MWFDVLRNMQFCPFRVSRITSTLSRHALSGKHLLACTLCRARFGTAALSDVRAMRERYVHGRAPGTFIGVPGVSSGGSLELLATNP